MKTKKKSNSKSLLYESLKHFTQCAIICFVVTLPLFYLLTKYFYAEDLIDLIEAVKKGEGIPSFDLEQDIILGMMIQFVLIFGVISLALFITMRVATRKLFAPFDDTLQKAERFNLAKDDVPQFVPSHIREFNRLNSALTQLMIKDKETYRIQKEFTENASHELQTPLAIVRSKIELLMQEDLSEHQMDIVSEVSDLLLRMTRLNRNLLLLARIENAQYTSLERINLMTTLYDSIPQYELLRGDVNLVLLDQTQSVRDLTIQANATLLDCMLKNLIVNAIRHALPDTDIRLLLTDDSITVSNASAATQPLDSNKLFTRFSAAQTGTGGNGLALSIVKAICDFHHWKIRYSFEDGRHTFCVRF